jgi:hypothetical protein
MLYLQHHSQVHHIFQQCSELVVQSPYKTRYKVLISSLVLYPIQSSHYEDLSLEDFQRVRLSDRIQANYQLTL